MIKIINQLTFTPTIVTTSIFSIKIGLAFTVVVYSRCTIITRREQQKFRRCRRLLSDILHYVLYNIYWCIYIYICVLLMVRWRRRNHAACFVICNGQQFSKHLKQKQTNNKSNVAASVLYHPMLLLLLLLHYLHSRSHFLSYSFILSSYSFTLALY